MYPHNCYMYVYESACVAERQCENTLKVSLQRLSSCQPSARPGQLGVSPFLIIPDDWRLCLRPWVSGLLWHVALLEKTWVQGRGHRWQWTRGGRCYLMINLCVTAGHSQVGRGREEQGVTVSLVCYIGSIAVTIITMMITIIKGMVWHTGYSDSAAWKSHTFLIMRSSINIPLFLICVLHMSNKKIQLTSKMQEIFKLLFLGFWPNLHRTVQ